MKLNPLFCDHAVLQRGVPLPVWGDGGVPGDKLELAFTRPGGSAPSVTYTRVNPDGTFRFVLQPQEAGGPCELAVRSGRGGEVVSRDIAVGEVWLASGQSNMAFAVRDARPGFGDEPDGDLRCFAVADDIGFGERTEARGKWISATLRDVGGFTAVGTFFAKRLRRELGVPVGILLAANGGTRIEAWMSRPALASTAAGRRELARFAGCLADARCWAEDPARPEDPPLDPGPDAGALAWAQPGCGETGWGTVRLPCWFSDLEGRMFNGAVWFRKTLHLPEAWRGQDLLLRIPGVDKHDIAFVNGVQVGATGHGMETEWYAAERLYRIPADLVADGAVTLAIRAWSFIYAGGVGSADGDFSLERADGAGFIDLQGEWRWKIELDYGRVAGGVAGLVAGNCNAPHALFDAKIAPLAPFALRGAIWYQGEDNANNCGDYRELLGALVRDWRYRWGQGDFPFAAVQLAGYGRKAAFNRNSPWSEVRNALLGLSRELPRFGIASALDVGSVTEIHPLDKRTVGERLAAWALNEAYGRGDVVPTGPRVASAVRHGRGIELFFDDCGDGLCTDDGGAPRGFFVSGGEGSFHAAEARLSGPRTVRVEAADVAHPVEIRYAWARNPETATLRNSAGLPASPFKRVVEP